MILHPQNPYDSSLIEASAGSGKTYQLTRRFLNLVSAGAKPSGILTITFTVKAATEMRERIIQEASLLLYKPERQAEFEREMDVFYQQYLRSSESPVNPPRSAQETAKAILSATQLLRITTIDALFYDWFSKFPWEASLVPDSGAMLNLPYKMMDSLQVQEVNRNAWDGLFTHKSQVALKHCLALLDLDSEQGILGLEQKIFELFRHYTFLWQSELETGKAMIRYPVEGDASEAYVFQTVTNELKTIIEHTKQKEILLQAVRENDLTALFKNRLFNQEGEISGNLIRGKTRDKLITPLQRVDEVVQRHLRLKKLVTLNKASEALYELYKLWLAEREKAKKQKGLVEFHDLAIGNYLLFHRPSSVGATWLIQKSIQHLMIDECQDTSLLQWSVFSKLIEELLAGNSDENAKGLANTVFLVGDKKQSIYGFREADPEVLDHMKTLLENFEKGFIPLHKSYRSAPIILDFVNSFFIKQLDPQFPQHEAANNEDGSLRVPDCGRIAILELDFAKDMKRSEGATLVAHVADEAKFLALYLRKALNGEIAHPVYDKKRQIFRQLTAADCVILYRSSTHVELFEEALHEHNIAFLREERKGFFNRNEICDFLALLRFLVDPVDTIALLTFLRSEVCRITDRKMLEVLLATSEETLREHAILEALNVSYPAEVARLQNLISQVYASSPGALLHLAYDLYDAPATYLAKFPGLEGEIAHKNLLKLLEFVLQLENQGHLSLASVLNQLDLMKKRDEEASFAGHGQAVRLMTIHKAKGLEFPFVALIKTNESWFRQDRYWAKVNGEQRGLALIATQKNRPKNDLFLNKIMNATEQSLLAEAERLLYVALTRASQYLVMTAHQSRSLADSFYPMLLNTIQNQNGMRISVESQAQGEMESPWTVLVWDRTFGVDIEEVETITDSYARTPELPKYQVTEKLLVDELSIVHPHEQGRYIAGVSLEKSKYPQHIQRFFGNLIHEALNHAALGSLDFTLVWREQLSKLTVHSQNDLEKFPDLQAEAAAEVLQLIKSDAWSGLMMDVEIVKPEMKIIHLKQQNLMVGACDLYIQKKSGEIIIVEWKTMNADQDEQFYELAHKFGFFRQLAQYVQAVQALYPSVKVQGYLWFTKNDRPYLLS